MTTESPPTRPSFPIVGVGASAGGLEAFRALLQAMPAHPGVAIVLVQHLDPRHESQLTSILSGTVQMPVIEATQGMKVDADHVYVIPPNVYMAISRGELVLTPRAEQSGPNLPIDYFLCSLASEMGSRALGVILSGGGADGTAGLEAIAAVGGITFAQTEGSAAHFSMPRSAIVAGVVDLVLTPDAIARELTRFGRHPYVAGSPEPALESREATQLTETFEFLCARSGVDFARYKKSTTRRRIHRRMALRRIDDAGEYLALLRNDAAEADALFQDLLLKVTRFFRDADVFEKLTRTVFPTLIAERSADEQLRIWVPGCSSGEEVYSLAICLVECLGDMAGNTPIKLLATDVNPAVLERARRGIYPESIAHDVSPERLRRYFRNVDGQYRVSQWLRDLCVFARHDVCAEPPFAHMDLISCRNMLIYVEPALQQIAMARFHYALRPQGFLLLGPSETPGELARRFTVVDRDSRIYRRSATHGAAVEVSGTSVDPARRRDRSPPPTAAKVPRIMGLLDAQREADHILARYAPPGVLIDEDYRVLQLRGAVASFLRSSDGPLNAVISDVAREGLVETLKAGIKTVEERNAPLCTEAVRFRDGDLDRSVRLHVIPVRPGAAERRFFLVLFEDPDQAQLAGPVPLGAAAPEVLLGRELDAARIHLQAVVEDYEATNEELSSANEEVHASNEELQTINEQLQTAKEELQSLNEELETVNEEQAVRNKELGIVNDDLTNLMFGTRIPVLMVSRDLRIRRLTPEAQKLFGLGPADVGRSLRDIPPVLELANLSGTVSRVIDSLMPAVVETQDREGHWYAVGIRVYETDANKIDGAVIAVTDIDASKRSELELRASRDFVSNVLDTVQDCLVALDADLRVRMANRTFYLTFGLLPEETVGSPLLEVGHGQLDIPRLRGLLEDVRASRTPVQGFELEHEVSSRGLRTLRLTIRPVLSEAREGSSILLGIQDVTEARAAALKIQQARRMESLGLLAGGIAHDLNNLLTPILGYASLALDMQPDGSEARPMLQDVMEASEQAASLVKQILTYTGKVHLVMAPQDLSKLLEGMRGILRPLVSATADVQFDLAPGLPAVEADASHIRQVVMNLVMNASEALATGSGTICIRTGMVDLPANVHRSPLSSEALPSGLYVYIEVADNGSGMSPETVARVFDPFFTTKFTGRGLGLAALVGIVHAHRGGVNVQSVKGQGSTFQVLLPCSERAPAPSRPALPPADRWQGRGAVLLVDDDDKVRALAARYLERHGFKVLMAGDGHQALRVFHEHRNEIVAALMDVTMPLMGGLEATRELRALQHDLPVLFMSGYGAENVSSDLEGHGVTELVQKPFSEAALIRALRRSLGDGLT